MSVNDITTPVSALRGVGKAKLASLERLGIRTLGDLLYFFPRAYERRGNVKLLGEAEYSTPCSFMLTVASAVRSTRTRTGMTISTLRAYDESGSAEIVFFNSPFVKDVFQVGAKFRFYGRLEYARNHVRLSSPKYEPYIESQPLADLIPVYPLTDGVSSKLMMMPDTNKIRLQSIVKTLANKGKGTLIAFII